MTNVDPAELVRRLYALGAVGDWEETEKLLSDDLVITEAPSLPFAGTYRGRGALRELYGIVMAGWDDPKIEHHGITGGDGYAVGLLTLHLTSRKTGRRFAHEVAEVFRIENNLVVEIKPFYFDTVEIIAER